MRLERISWQQAEEYFARKDIAVVPVGSIENHGSHLALGTDTLVPQKLVDMVEDRLDVLFTPIMCYGLSDHHKGFPGTISIGYDALYGVMKSIADSLFENGVRKIVFLNGHGGNEPVLQRVGIELNAQGGLAAILNWWQLAGQLNPKFIGGHAGKQETSAMMAIDEGLVDMSRVEPFAMKELSPDFKTLAISTVDCNGVPVPVPRQVHNVAASGWVGYDDPAASTAAWGEEMLKTIADFVVDFVQKFEKVDLS